MRRKLGRGCEVFGLAPQSRTRNAPSIVEAPVSPAVGGGMFTPTANHLPVLWSTGMPFFLRGVLREQRLKPAAHGPRGGPAPLRARPAPVAAGRAGRPAGNATTIAF